MIKGWTKSQARQKWFEAMKEWNETRQTEKTLQGWVLKIWFGLIVLALIVKV